MNEWIPIDGRDAGAAYPTYINPDAVATVSFWTDQASKRVVTLELFTGKTVELREPRPSSWSAASPAGLSR